MTDVFTPFISYGIIAVILFIAELIYFKIADRFNIIDKPNQRSSHSSITLRGGGVIFYIGMVVYAAISGLSYPWFLLGLSMISIISFMDDVMELSPKVRLVIQFSAMALMFYQWGLTSMPLWYIAVALIICTGIINAYNFMDGINGITGGYSLAVLIPLAWLNREFTFVDSEMIYTAIISVLVFNYFNFRTKAKCFAGDVGSVAIAFIVLFFLGQLILKTENLAYIMFLGIYGVDSVLTIVHRIMLKENITKPHRKHLYQLMANELKIKHITVSSFYMALQLIVSFGLIYYPGNQYLYGVCVLAVLALGYVWFMRRWFSLHVSR